MKKKHVQSGRTFKPGDAGTRELSAAGGKQDPKKTKAFPYAAGHKVKAATLGALAGLKRILRGDSNV